MSFSVLPLSYCSNVHPGLTISDLFDAMKQQTCAVQEEFQKKTGLPISTGLWLAEPVIQELTQSPDAIDRFACEMQSLGLSCYTLNAFPYGDFHDDRVKEQVYLPDWTTAERLDYTIRCANVLSRLLPPGTEGSVSTVPLGFKSLVETLQAEILNPEEIRGIRYSFDFEKHATFVDACITNLLQLARELDRLHDETGSVIRLAIEPEPLCVLETTEETCRFFRRLWDIAESRSLLKIAQRHLGVCYDVCHQAVEFEDVAESIRSLNDAGIRLNKIHITCALEVIDPGQNADAREALAQYIEPRYLHQTFARFEQGKMVQNEIHFQADLSASLLQEGNPFYDANCWRIHYHVPVNAESIGPLGTTRDELKKALVAVNELEYAPHLEVETYTWNVLPNEKTVSLVDGLVDELFATRQLLERIKAER